MERKMPKGFWTCVWWGTVAGEWFITSCASQEQAERLAIVNNYSDPKRQARAVFLRVAQGGKP